MNDTSLINFVWDVTVDGKKMTVIDPDQETLESMTLQLQRKFGVNRLESVKRRINTGVTSNERSTL